MGNTNKLPTVDKKLFVEKVISNNGIISSKIIYRRNKNDNIINGGEKFKNIKFITYVKTYEYLKEIFSIFEYDNRKISLSKLVNGNILLDINNIKTVDFSHVTEIDLLISTFLRDLYPNHKTSHIKLIQSICVIGKITLDEIKNPEIKFLICPFLIITESIFNISIYFGLKMEKYQLDKD